MHVKKVGKGARPVAPRTVLLESGRLVDATAARSLSFFGSAAQRLVWARVGMLGCAFEEVWSGQAGRPKT